ncbi:hypothetical protein Tco_0511542 [Tanacetum coccineum]
MVARLALFLVGGEHVTLLADSVNMNTRLEICCQRSSRCFKVVAESTVRTRHDNVFTDSSREAQSFLLMELGCKLLSSADAYLIVECCVEYLGLRSKK